MFNVFNSKTCDLTTMVHPQNLSSVFLGRTCGKYQRSVLFVFLRGNKRGLNMFVKREILERRSK